MRPATERLRAERARIQAQNAAMQRLLRRKEALARRLEQTLTEVKAERRAIAEELDRILSGNAASSG